MIPLAIKTGQVIMNNTIQTVPGLDRSVSYQFTALLDFWSAGGAWLLTWVYYEPTHVISNNVEF